MATLCDRQIKELVESSSMIDPFEPNQITNVVASWGLTSYGYDLRLDPKELFIFHNAHGAIIDPANPNEDMYVKQKPHGLPPLYFIIPPNSFALGQSLEYLRIPRSMWADCRGKSTYARCGIIINVTPCEPEWEGRLTIEISNTAPLPAKIYAAQGIAKLLFNLGSQVCDHSYPELSGRYQDQLEITLPRPGRPPKVHS